MANLLVGDVHGCYDELIALLEKAAFNPAQDTLWLTGDVVARGPKSLEVLRYLKSLGSSLKMVLGNHDLHLLSIYAGIRRNKPKDHFDKLLAAPDCKALLDWLRSQPLLQVDEDLKLVMAHAGITPQWDLNTAKQCAHELEIILSSGSYPLFLNEMYGDYPNEWSPELQGLRRLRFSANALTRMRYCHKNGQLDFECKAAPKNAPSHLAPWFNFPSPLKDAGYSIAFGHWAALSGKHTPEHIYALDTGCCWGEKLTLLHFETKQIFHQKSFQPHY